MNLRVLKFTSSLISSFKKVSLGSQNYSKFLFSGNQIQRLKCATCIHTSGTHLGLMEFFDDKENWTVNEIRVGRAWKKEELRIKSNQDLHKLWFVLLKERNMLLTMEHEYNEKLELFPSPERIDKVKESMINLEEVVRERNKAYYMLETGETGERPGKVANNSLGMRYFYKCAEHILPPEKNRHWFAKRKLWYNRKEVKKFLLYYREKLFLEKRKARIRERNHVLQLLKRFPDTDMEALQDLYPNVDLARLKTWKKARGHWVPE
uniref:Large ribosomal subunit protein uL29m n=1 Tax=Panstrongylus megistus TaxID=65343 RepID=A0A069DY66_9HEMI